MAVSLTNFKRYPVSGRYKVIADVTFSGSYVTGGSSEIISAAALGMSQVESMQIQPKGGVSFEYDYPTGNTKVMLAPPLTVYQQSSPIAAQNIQTRLGGSPSVKIEGTASDAADHAVQLGPSTALGRLVEATAGDNLSTITTRLEAMGY